MYSIIDKETGLLIIASCFSDCEENEIAIDKICDIENPEGKDIYFNFETQKFEVR